MWDSNTNKTGSTTLKEWTTPDFWNTPSTTNLEEEEIVDAPGNDGNASMPEQVKRPNICRKMMMMTILRHSKCFHSFSFPNQKPVCITVVPCTWYFPHYYHYYPPWLHQLHSIWWRAQIMELIMQFSPEFSFFFFLGSSIFLNILFLNTLRLCPSLKKKDHVSWPYKKAAANL